MTFSSFLPPCPAYVLPSPWPNSAAASTHQALAWALYKPNSEKEVSEQSHWLVDSWAEVSFRGSGTVWDLPIPNGRLLPHDPDSSNAFLSEMCYCVSTEHGITLQKQPFKGLKHGVPLCSQLTVIYVRTTHFKMIKVWAIQLSWFWMDAVNVEKEDHEMQRPGIANSLTMSNLPYLVSSR